MHHFDLDTFLSGHVFAFLFIFARLGSALILMPGIGEAFVSARTRLMFAFMLVLVVMEPLMPRIPPIPNDIGGLLHIMSYEVIIGLFFGTLLRLLLSALEATGTVIGLQTGLSNATVLNPTLASQSPLPSALLSTMGTTMIFASGLDHAIFRSLIAIYDIFPPGGDLMPGDMAETIINIANKSFVIGVEIAMPFFVIGLLLYVALGLIQKLLPNVQLFLVGMPLQIYSGLLMLGLTVGSMLGLWLHYFDDSLTTFMSR